MRNPIASFIFPLYLVDYGTILPFLKEKSQIRNFSLQLGFSYCLFLSNHLVLLFPGSDAGRDSPVADRFTVGALR